MVIGLVAKLTNNDVINRDRYLFLILYFFKISDDKPIAKTAIKEYWKPKSYI